MGCCPEIGVPARELSRPGPGPDVIRDECPPKSSCHRLSGQSHFNHTSFTLQSRWGVTVSPCQGLRKSGTRGSESSWPRRACCEKLREPTCTYFINARIGASRIHCPPCCGDINHHADSGLLCVYPTEMSLVPCSSCPIRQPYERITHCRDVENNNFFHVQVRASEQQTRPLSFSSPPMMNILHGLV